VKSATPTELQRRLTQPCHARPPLDRNPLSLLSSWQVLQTFLKRHLTNL
jgi:hypothetical protein